MKEIDEIIHSISIFFQEVKIKILEFWIKMLSNNRNK